MTVAMFLSKPRPILISDCLALPSSGGVIHYSPSNIEFSFGSDCKLASLVSKILFLDGSTIVAFSGRSDNIGEFAKILQERWAVRDTALRPMQYVHRLDSEIRATRGSRWECSVLGASIKSFGAGDSNYDINSYASLNDC